MATYRIGIGSEFQLKDNAVGVGKSRTGLGNLNVEGTFNKKHFLKQCVRNYF